MKEVTKVTLQEQEGPAGLGKGKLCLSWVRSFQSHPFAPKAAHSSWFQVSPYGSSIWCSTFNTLPCWRLPATSDYLCRRA